MPSLYEEPQNTMNQASEQHDIKTKIIDTSLYSVFLLSSSQPAIDSCQALLVEHLPAKKPATHVLPLEITTASTKTEILKKVAAAVEAHYTKAEHFT